MAAPLVEQVTERPGTLAENESLPEKPKAEFYGGTIVVSPPARIEHQDVVAALLTRLRPILPAGYRCLMDVGMRHGGNRFVPDLIVFAETDEEVWVEDAVLCVEVVSPGNSRYDYVRKTNAYARAGVGNYWIVDPLGDTVEITIFRLSENGGYAEQPFSGSATIPELGLEVDLNGLGRPSLVS